MAANRSVCPRCRRVYNGPVRVCMVDGTPLVDEERLAEAEARGATMQSAAPPPPEPSAAAITRPAQRYLGSTGPHAMVPSEAAPLPGSRKPTPRPFPVPIPAVRLDENPHTNPGFE